MDSDCPLHVWDLRLPQIDMLVNLQRQSNLTLKVSAHAHLHRQHDFNWHPLTPMGIKERIYVPPYKLKTWEVKTKKGFYVGTSLEHYRYYTAWVPETGAVQGLETMYFKHKYITDPAVMPADAVVQAAKQLADALKGVGPPPMAASSVKQL